MRKSLHENEGASINRTRTPETVEAEKALFALTQITLEWAETKDGWEGKGRPRGRWGHRPTYILEKEEGAGGGYYFRFPWRRGQYLEVWGMQNWVATVEEGKAKCEAEYKAREKKSLRRR